MLFEKNSFVLFFPSNVINLEFKMAKMFTVEYEKEMFQLDHIQHTSTHIGESHQKRG